MLRKLIISGNQDILHKQIIYMFKAGTKKRSAGTWLPPKKPLSFRDERWVMQNTDVSYVRLVRGTRGWFLTGMTFFQAAALLHRVKLQSPVSKCLYVHRKFFISLFRLKCKTIILHLCFLPLPYSRHPSLLSFTFIVSFLHKLLC